jgi:broad specificity phosphatase PhoE
MTNLQQPLRVVAFLLSPWLFAILTCRERAAAVDAGTNTRPLYRAQGDMESSTRLSAHSDVTLALAQKESAEHMAGMKELYEAMRRRPLRVRAYTRDDPLAPPLGTNHGNQTAVKLVHFVRHGQGFHNLMADTFTTAGKQWTQFQAGPDNPYTMPELLDSPLTNKGRQQAAALQQSMTQEEDFPSPQMVVVSPMCRTLQTAILAFAHLIQSATPFVAHEMAREECGVHLCDQRRSKSQQMLEFPYVNFDLLSSELDPLYQEHTRETKLQVADRIYQFLQWLEQSPSDVLAVVSHSGWLLTLFNGLCECPRSADQLQGWFQTGELRSVILEFEINEESNGDNGNTC